MRNRFDETWHRLLEWTKGQTPSERLAGQILIHEGFLNFDPSHPLGGKDGGKDAIAIKDGIRFVMAVYFPRGKQAFGTIKSKFTSDLAGSKNSGCAGLAFVTNQELTLAEREELRSLSAPMIIDLYHLERITAILDTPIMAAVREQFLDIATDISQVLNLGGGGGNTPGAGGGGGGVIGSGTGGQGGPGGTINLHGGDGLAPGAGGGGAGAIGENAVGGEGGGGGEYFSILLGPNEIGPDSKFHHAQIHVGKGGKNDGPGADSAVNLCDEHGNVLRSITAKGGTAGKPAHTPLQGRTPTAADIKSGLRVSGIIAAEILRCRDGLWTIVEGGWDFVRFDTNPFQISLNLLVEIETGRIEPGTLLELKLITLDPEGFQLHEQTQPVVVPDGLVRRSRFGASLNCTGQVTGLWRVKILAGDQVIGEYPIEVRAPV